MELMIKQLIPFLLAHSTAVTVVTGLVGTAFASTFPEQRPKTLDDYWNWARDFVHQIANAKRPTIATPKS
jgi:3-oxoacyl-ACP reductase-like protein